MKLRHPNCLRPQPAWMAALAVGSVIHRPRGSWRVVREVSRYQNGDLRAVALAIKRCSWARRCYTILNANDMIQLGYGPVPVGRRKLRGRLDYRCPPDFSGFTGGKITSPFMSEFVFRPRAELSPAGIPTDGTVTTFAALSLLGCHMAPSFCWKDTIERLVICRRPPPPRRPPTCSR